MTTAQTLPFADGTPEPTYELKYLFEVEFKNGARYLQNARDISAFDSLRTPWYDIESERLQPMSEIATLTIFNENTHILTDLVTGNIEINGLPLWCCDTLSYLPPATQLQAYYKRRIRRRWKVGYNLQFGNPETKQFDGLWVQYIVGWDCIVEGSAHKARLAIE